MKKPECLCNTCNLYVNKRTRSCPTINANRKLKKYKENYIRKDSLPEILESNDIKLKNKFKAMVEELK